jgi:hypothetical protein
MGEETFFPVKIIITCDECGRKSANKYLVTAEDDEDLRFRYARQYLEDEEGWLILKGELDICPSCAKLFS